MRLTLKDYRGVAAAELDLADTVTVFAGENGSGKSSACLALAGLLTGTTSPITGRQGGDKAIAVREGAKFGTASLAGDGWSVSIEWPGGEIKSEGNQVIASPIAVGLVAWSEMTQAERATMFRKAFKVVPTADDLRVALESKGLADWFDVVSADLKKNGWNTAATNAEDARAAAKSAFKTASGILWGENKAPTWLERNEPPETIESLEALLAELGRNRDRAIATAAVSRVTLRQRQDAAAELAKAKEALRLAKPDFDGADARANAALSRWRAEDALPAPPCHCPGCGVQLDIVAGKLVESTASGPFQDPAKLRALKLEETEAANSRLQTQQALERLQKEIARLEPLSAGADQQPDATQAEAEELAAKIKEVEQKLDAARKWKLAGEAHEEVLLQDELHALLSENGVRRAKSLQVLDVVNARLETMAGQMKCLRVWLDKDLVLNMGNLPFKALSAAERFRALALLQILIARSEGSAVVILDGADILDQRGRNGLGNVLLQNQVRGVLGMTHNRPDQSVNLEKIGGRSYWFGRGGAMKREAAIAACQPQERKAA